MVYKSSPRGTSPVSLIAIHTAEGALTAESLGAYFYRDDIQASSHVGIDSAKILQYVNYDRAAWTIRSGNPITDNAELCGFAAWSRDEWLTNHMSMLRLSASWTRGRCLARGIPMTLLGPADVAAGRWGIIGHDDWTYGMHDGTHTDPGPTFPWDVFIQLVRQEGIVDMQWDEERDYISESGYKERHPIGYVESRNYYNISDSMKILAGVEGDDYPNSVGKRIQRVEDAVKAMQNDLQAIKAAVVKG